MDMGVMEMEPRTSMERHLMDRDREGQLYLEARRHQAAQDLLQNRTSFLSTITPPSTNPSSAASSLFREPISTHNQLPRSAPFDSSSFSSMPTTPPTGALSSFSQQRDQTILTISSFAPIQNIPPKKTRHRSGSSTKGRPKGLEAPMPLKPISPSSLEYQLTANLLKSLDNKSRTRSHSRSHPTKRRGTASSQNRPQHHILTSGQSTGQKTNDEEEESPSTSALGFSVSARPSHHHQQHQHQDILLIPMRPRSPGVSSSRPSTPPLPLTPNSPMYPKGLLPHPHSPLLLDLDRFQKPPYVELLTKATTPPSSTNTSRDLEMVLEGITRGQLRASNNNRTSMDPWLYSHSPWDDKPLPPVRREPGERYWVFRDRDGLWVMCVRSYPRTRHPGETPVVVKRQASRAQLWIRDRWELVKVKGIVLITPFVARGSQKTFSTSLESVACSHEGVSIVGRAATVGNGPASQGVILGSLEEEEETTRGPWSATSDRGSSLFEQRMEYDRKVLRYELDLRWRRMNLAWSVGSFVLAIAITAVVLAST
ncbi:hypothetical protein CPC16_010630 [Podila verticillata]|nr:hypothetical protein CPC16_010630 [Podila verticillata]